MDIRFLTYRFSVNDLILYQRDNSILELKTKQAELLRLFVCEPEKIHSKEDILEALWRNQDVSEQVVFQTVSQLRGILGNDV